MKKTAERIICTLVAAVMLAVTLAGCTLTPKENNPVGDAGSQDASKTTAAEKAPTDFSTDGKTTEPGTDTAAVDTTPGSETNAADTADGIDTGEETTGSETEAADTVYGIDAELWASLPEELRRQIEELGERRGFDDEYSGEAYTFCEIRFFVYPYFNEKEYTVLDFKEIEDCTGVKLYKEGGDGFFDGNGWIIELSSDSPRRVHEILQILKKRPDICAAYPGEGWVPQ